MTEAASLLPSNATPRQRAVEAVSAPRWDLPVGLITAVGRAEDCPADLLGHLAWARSVDLWRDEWPIELKRHVTARAFLDQRLKGTLDLYARYLGYVGASLIRAITPPSRFVLGRRRTEAETAALLAGMPELRIHREAEPRRPGRRAVWGRFGWGGTGWSATTSLDHHETRAEMIADGVTTRLRIAEIIATGVDADLGAFSRLYIPHGWGGSRVLGAGHGRRQRRWGKPVATTWVVSASARGTAGRRTVARGLVPAEAEPETIMARHRVPTGKAWIGRRRPGRRWWRGSSAAAAVYDRLRLWDDAAATRSRRKRSYWSWSWRGQPTHSAVLSISVARRAPPRKRWWGHGFRGALRPHDGTALSAALEAISAATLPHETILVDLETALERRFFGA